MPTLEIYEKVAEISAIHLRTAEENRRIAEEENARIAEERRIAEEKRKAEMKEKSVEVALKILEIINSRAEKGLTSVELMWKQYEKSHFDLYSREFIELIPYIRNVLSPLGYTIEDFYHYSTSWVYKSGREGYCTIYW